jgi:hypothetical protein
MHQCLEPKIPPLAIAIVAFLAASCAPALPKPEKGWVLEAKPTEVLTTQKNPDGSFVKVKMTPRIEHLEEKRAENEKWRKLAREASREENDGMERLCEHPWWDRKMMKRHEEDDPWHMEKKVEDLQASEDTTFYVTKTDNFACPLSQMKEYLANAKKRDEVPGDTTVDQYAKRIYTGNRTFLQLTLKPKPEGKPRERLQVIRALLDALDDAQKEEDK